MKNCLFKLHFQLTVSNCFSQFLTAAEQHSVQSNVQLAAEGEPPTKKKRCIPAANVKSQDIDVITALQSMQQNQGSQTFD